MIQTLFIPGPLPGLNQLLQAKAKMGQKVYRNGIRWNGLANLKKQHGDAIYWEAMAQKLKPMTRAYLIFEWHELDDTRDPDNLVAGGRKIILDALVKAGILPDDGWEHIVGWRDQWRLVATKPGVLITMDEQSL